MTAVERPPLTPTQAARARQFLQMAQAARQAPLLPEVFPGAGTVPRAAPRPTRDVPPGVARLRDEQHLNRRLAELSVPAPRERDCTAQEVADLLAAQMMPGRGKKKAKVRKTLSALLKIALEYARHQGYHQLATSVVFHLPQELLASHLGICRQTLGRHVTELQLRGLLQRASHKTSNGRLIVSDGTLWVIKLTPQVRAAPKLTYDDLKRQYRDLPADIRAGNTVWARLGGHARKEVQQSTAEGLKAVEAEELVAWAVTPGSFTQTPLEMTGAKSGASGLEAVWSVYSVPQAHRTERCPVVDGVAQGLAQAMHDPHVAFFRWMLWQLLRLSDVGQDHWGNVVALLERVQADMREGYARNPTALFIARLRELGLLELFRSAPPNRVALGVIPH